MQKGPTRQERIRLAKVMEHQAICEVSPRWLQFPQTARLVGGVPMMIVNVMTTNSDDQDKKLCELVLSKSDLLQILARIEVKNY